MPPLLGYGDDVDTIIFVAIDGRVWKSADDYATESICNWRTRFGMRICKCNCGLNFGGEFQTQARVFSVIEERRSFEFGTSLGMELRLVH